MCLSHLFIVSLFLWDSIVLLLQTWENAKPGVGGHSRTPQVLQATSLCPLLPGVPAQSSGCLRACVPLTGGWVSLRCRPHHLRHCLPAWSRVASSDPCRYLVNRTFLCAPSSHHLLSLKGIHHLSMAESELGCSNCRSLSQAPPNTTSLNQVINRWPFIHLRRWLSGSQSPSYLTFLQEAVSLMRPCHCNRDSGDDKLQDSEKKDHPGTMGMMGTILALLERGSHGRC